MKVAQLYYVAIISIATTSFGCATMHKDAQTTERLSSEDYEVYSIAIDVVVPKDYSRGSVWINPLTRDTTTFKYQTPDQAANELKDMYPHIWHDDLVPLVKDYLIRNRTELTIARRFTCKRKVKIGATNLDHAPPGQFWIWLSVPGYSADGQTALLRTARYASWQYLVFQKVHGTWQLIGRKSESDE